MSRYLCFINRLAQSPVENFKMTYHHLHLQHLRELNDALSHPDNDPLCFTLIHRLIMSLLSHNSDSFTSNTSTDSHTLFLIASNLLNDAGLFAEATHMTSDISAVQWCFRASCVHEMKRLITDHAYLPYPSVPLQHLSQVSVAYSLIGLVTLSTHSLPTDPTLFLPISNKITPTCLRCPTPQSEYPCSAGMWK